MKIQSKLIAASGVAMALSMASASAQLVDVQFVSEAGPNGGPYGGTSSVQTGAAVLGSSGDIWNQGSIGYFTEGNPGLAPTSLNDVTGASTPLTISAYQPGNAVYSAHNASGGATDLGTSALMSSDIEQFNLGGGAYWIMQIQGLNAYVGDSFTLEVYAGAPSAQSQSIYFTSGYNGVAVTGGNTASTLTTSSTDRMLSGGQGDAYVEFTGTIVNNANNTMNFIVSDPSTPGYTPGAYVNGIQLDLITPTPEPSTIALAALGGMGMLTLIRRRNA